MLLRAFAKINLDLRILGKRADGFHEVRTVFQSIDWFDEIIIEPAGRFEFSATAGPEDETNLVVKAVRLFERSGRRANVRIALHKNVPSGAGLGGGSSDAMAAFIGLSRFFGVETRFDLARSLGSDVYFFAYGGRALGTGRGDEIQPLQDETDYWLVLVNPSVFISTAEAYSWLTVPYKTNSIEGFCAQFVPGSEPAELKNDFEMPVFARHPQLMEIRNDLLRTGAFRAAMSGSGSVMFGQFHTREEAERAGAILGGRYSVKVTRPLSRTEYFSRMFG